MTLLSVDDLRKWPEFASVDEDVLTFLLAAAETDIERELGGPVGTATEVVDGRLLTFLTLRRRAVSITSVTTDWDQVETTLASDDYRIATDRRSIFRLGTGTNPGARWPLTTVVYEPEDDETSRKRAQKALVSLDLNYAPGQTSEQIGAWMEQHSQSSSDYIDQRRAILASLWPSDGIDFA